MIELSSLADIRRVGRLSINKPISLKVRPRDCGGVTFEEVTSVFHGELSDLRPILGSAQTEKDGSSYVLWLSAIEKANKLTSLKQLNHQGNGACDVLPDRFARTTLSHGISATLTVLTLEFLKFSPKCFDGLGGLSQAFKDWRR